MFLLFLLSLHSNVWDGIECALLLELPVLHPNTTLSSRRWAIDPNITECDRSSALCLLKLQVLGLLFADISSDRQPRIFIYSTVKSAGCYIKNNLTRAYLQSISRFKVGVMNGNIQAILKRLLLGCSCCKWCSGVFVVFHIITPPPLSPRDWRCSCTSLLVLDFIHHCQQNKVLADIYLQLKKNITVNAV